MEVSVSIHLCIGEWVGTHDLCLSEFVFVIGDHGKITQTNEFLTSMSTRNACITVLGMVRGRILRIYIELIIEFKSR